MGERRTILLTMLEAVYIETVEERTIVALKPKPAFQALFQVATPREGSGVALFTENENPPITSGESTPCSWWRRGRVELGLNTYLSNSFSARELVLVELLAA